MNIFRTLKSLYGHNFNKDSEDITMSVCNVEVIKQVGRYYNVPVGTVCYNTDKVITYYD